MHRYPDGPHELFDLAADPGERRNLVDDAAHADVLATLRSRLDGWFARYVDPARDGVDKGVTGCGQLGLVAGADGRRVFADQHLVGADWDLWLEPRTP